MSPKRSGWMGDGMRMDINWLRSKSQRRSKMPRSRKRRNMEFLEGSFLAMRLRYWLRKDKELPKQFRSAKKLHEALAWWYASGDQVCVYG